MRARSKTPATSKIEFFVAIIKKWKLLNTVPKSSIFSPIRKTRKHKCQMSYYDMWKLQ